MIEDLPRPWIEHGLRFALHLGVASPDKPLFANLVGSTDPLDHIRFAADIGFAGITDNCLKGRERSVQSAMGDELARLGLEMGSFTNSPMGTPNSYWGNPDRAFDTLFDQSIKDSIEAAKRTGGRIITLCALASEGIDPAKQRSVFAQRIAAVADLVAREGCMLAIEPTSATRTPFFLIHHIEHALEVMGSEHPGISLMFDTGHIHEMDGDPAELFMAHKGRVETVQIADVVQRLAPGSGKTDFQTFFATLKRCKFSKLVELEHYHLVDGPVGERSALDQLAEIVGRS